MAQRKPSRDPEPTWWSDALLIALAIEIVALAAVGAALIGGWL